MTATARGLFKATGNKAKPVHIMLDGEIVKSDSLVREKTISIRLLQNPRAHSSMLRLSDCATFLAFGSQQQATAQWSAKWNRSGWSFVHRI